ncbi:hypothetical protein SEVIR_3G052000v4 [Setaria viridis]|uniref:Uncharacterized protein n=2 Tax=Setaria TaxID=4554 RepID=A0A368QBL1_SETIT|nr:hypothetical protein SETIT_3G051500v2 [Setaria italica]TKW24460.1 hypothetical protein SEVIR_3G052000v2 [Setaria viridis]RCV15375.1 hypothetical protein SETIT_3G051500v2 [Setaria italica]TKW24461.1 hypothetical protein SEVIR_3G052000v2 [Setaria viridis]TKW24462.1 hypothetical protein SEVIR_3G052000v2 [Setaria viridis]
MVAMSCRCRSGWGAVGLNFAWLHPPAHSFRVDTRQGKRLAGPEFVKQQADASHFPTLSSGKGTPRGQGEGNYTWDDVVSCGTVGIRTTTLIIDFFSTDISFCLLDMLIKEHHLLDQFFT